MSFNVQNTCKSARVFSRHSSKKRPGLNKSLGTSTILQEGFDCTSLQEGREMKRSDSETSTIQNIPYMTKQPTGTLSNTRKDANRSLMKSKSKSFSDITHILSQRGSKCLCFDQFGTHQGESISNVCSTFCKKLGPKK